MGRTDICLYRYVVLLLVVVNSLWGLSVPSGFRLSGASIYDTLVYQQAEGGAVENVGAKLLNVTIKYDDVYDGGAEQPWTTPTEWHVGNFGVPPTGPFLGCLLFIPYFEELLVPVPYEEWGYCDPGCFPENATASRYWPPVPLGNPWNAFLQPYSALGEFGPLGPYGPLSDRGIVPHMDSFVDPEAAYEAVARAVELAYATVLCGGNKACGSAFYAWEELFRKFLLPPYDADNMQSPLGPLGEAGPLNPVAFYRTMYHLNEIWGANNFPSNLDITGVWGILGPLGPLGPMGVLSALGPMGIPLAEGYGTTEGRFVNASGDVVTSALVRYSASGDTRQYPLYEVYRTTEALALGCTSLDCTFMVNDGNLSAGATVSLCFTSHVPQIVSVLVVPIRGMASEGPADFSISISMEPAGPHVLISNKTNAEIMDYVVFMAQSHAYYVTISNESAYSGSFYLYVQGSGFTHNNSSVPVFDHWNIVGDFQSTGPFTTSP